MLLYVRYRVTFPRVELTLKGASSHCNSMTPPSPLAELVEEFPNLSKVVSWACHATKHLTGLTVQPRGQGS